MAYVLIENEKVINNYRGVTVYHVYQYDEQEYPKPYHFSTEPYAFEEDESVFDVREMEGYDPEKSATQNLMFMIDKGVIGEQQEKEETFFAADKNVKEGFCPICGGKLVYQAKEASLDAVDLNYVCTCTECGCAGTELHRLHFDGYEVF